MDAMDDLTKEQLLVLLSQQNAALEQKDAALEQKDVLLAEQAQAIVKQQQAYAELQAEFSILIQRLFGRRSERYLENPDQLKLDFGGDGPELDDAVEGLKDAIVASEQAAESTTPKRRKKRRNEKLPEHFPRQEKIVDLLPEEKAGLKFIGYDITETLFFTRPQLRVVQTKYAKYVNPQQPEQGVHSPSRPPSLVEGNRYDTSVAAEIIVGKFGYHLPIYRQQDWFAGSGWTPSRSTLLNIQAAAAELIEPFVEYLANEVRRDCVIGTDDTGVTLLIPKAIPEAVAGDDRSQRIQDVIGEAVRDGKPHVKAKVWAYRGVTVPLNVFDFTVSRHRDGPDAFLIETGYEGVLLGDCYSGYTGISHRSSEAIQHAACVAHARRKVFEARDNHPVHASNLLAMFQELYDIEDRGKAFNAAGLLELRQREAAAVWDRMRVYLDSDAIKNVLPKEALGKAIGYLNNHWDALQAYVSNPRIPIDNNETEQLMKQVALGRKNWLFIGSIAAGERAANLLTLVSSAVRNDLDVWAYVKAVLDALLAGSTDYASLRPDVWASAHPEQIRRYRVEERRDRADRKQRRRVKRRALTRRSDPA